MAQMKTENRRKTISFSGPVYWINPPVSSMASAENIERDFNLNKIKESDALFMEFIQEYPTIYNQASNDFKDRNKNFFALLAGLLKD